MIEEFATKLLTEIPMVGAFFLLWRMMDTTLKENTKALNALENAIIELKGGVKYGRKRRK